MDGNIGRKVKKRQRWHCKACNKKMLNPKIIEKSPFQAEERPVDFVPIDEIISHRKKQYNQKLKAKKSRKLRIEYYKNTEKFSATDSTCYN